MNKKKNHAPPQPSRWKCNSIFLFGFILQFLFVYVGGRVRIPQGQGGWLEDSLQVASLSFYYVGSREHQAARLSRKHLYHGVISPDQQCWFFFIVCLFVF